MNELFIKLFVFIFSRPIFFKPIYFINKLCLYAMNRISAASLNPKYSGEKVALEWALNKLHNHGENSKELVLFDCGANYDS